MSIPRSLANLLAEGETLSLSEDGPSVAPGVWTKPAGRVGRGATAGAEGCRSSGMEDKTSSADPITAITEFTGAAAPSL